MNSELPCSLLILEQYCDHCTAIQVLLPCRGGDDQHDSRAPTSNGGEVPLQESNRSSLYSCINTSRTEQESRRPRVETNPGSVLKILSTNLRRLDEMQHIVQYRTTSSCFVRISYSLPRTRSTLSRLPEICTRSLVLFGGQQQEGSRDVSDSTSSMKARPILAKKMAKKNKNNKRKT